ncbi:RCC1 domain-containing protein [Chitinimonas koreensis]|uniref:RCC1 domain-containing protein n=1 Tax=Chitinimonas koreensis TaxID=356302 RepID=UPI00357108F2
MPQPVPGLAGVTAIAASASQSLALRADGSVWAWGQNNAGQLGIGSYTDAWLPTRAVDLPAVTAIAAGLLHTLALGRDGKVYAWGDNAYCQLGVADQFGICHAQPRPVLVPAISGIKAIAAGSGHSAVLKMDGTAWSWGHNQFGQLGNDGPVGVGQVSAVPVKAQGLAGGVEIVARGATTLVRTVDGALYGIGFNGQGQVGNGLGAFDGNTYQMARVPQRTLGAGGEGWLYLGSGGVLERCSPQTSLR